MFPQAMAIKSTSGPALQCFLVITLAVLPIEVAVGVRDMLWPGSPSNDYGGNVPAAQSPAPAMPSGGICSTMVEMYGYPCEEHTVTTEDGYILGMQRIPAGRSASALPGDKATPVLLQHGLLMDGITWLLNSPNQSLGFILADNGFDVWIGNTRGTVHSRGHTSLTADDPAYWDWSWEELKEYDLPAMVNYVHAQAGQRLHYAGHSLGTLVALTSFSQQKLVDQVRSAGLLSPLAYMGQMTSKLTKGAAECYAAEALYWLGMNEFNPKGNTTEKLLQSVCKTRHVDCYDLLSSLTGKNCCLNSSSVDIFLQNEPQPTATKNMVHLAQMTRTGAISEYDYGKVGNLRHYGSLNPPLYDMSGIPADLPLFLSYGGQDELSDPQDVLRLLEILESHGVNHTVQYLETYAHMDFVMGVSARQEVYDPLVAFFTHQ